MVFEELIKGKYIQLRAATLNDAEFILSLRLDPSLNKYLHATDASVESQKKWMMRQQAKEGDYYFVIESKEGVPLGVVGVYDIVGKTFNWGRWIVKKDAPMYTSIESTILVYYFAFYILNLDTALSDVRVDNKNVIKFHVSYGSKIYKETDLDIYYEFLKESFSILLKKFKGFHNIELK